MSREGGNEGGGRIIRRVRWEVKEGEQIGFPIVNLILIEIGNLIKFYLFEYCICILKKKNLFGTFHFDAGVCCLFKNIGCVHIASKFNIIYLH